jgi:hypothetical protein
MATLGAVLRISTAGVIETMYAVPLCSPAGLTLGPNEELLVGCNVVFDTAGGKWTGNADTDTNVATPYQVILDATFGFIVRYVPGVGAGDEVWFNSGDGHYYTASSGSPYAPSAITPPRTDPKTAPTLTAQGAAVLGVIDAFSHSLDQLVPTFQVPAVSTPPEKKHPAGTAHSVAANSKNNLVFVPIAANNAFGFPIWQLLDGVYRSVRKVRPRQRLTSDYCSLKVLCRGLVAATLMSGVGLTGGSGLLIGLGRFVDQRRVTVGAAAERPVVFAVALFDRQIVDTGDAQAHQAMLVEFPVLVSVAAEPVAAIIVPFIRKADGDAVLSKGPDLLDQAVVEFALPFARQECVDGVAAL